MSADREFQIGATGRFNLTTSDRPGGTPVEPDSAPEIVRMFVDGNAVDPADAQYANAIVQRAGTNATPIVGRYEHSFSTSAFTRLSNVEFVYQATIDGIVKETFASATFRDDPASVPGFDAA